MSEHHSHPQPRTSLADGGTFRVYAYTDATGRMDGQIPCPGATPEAAWRNVEPFVRDGIQGFIEHLGDDGSIDFDEDLADTVRLFTVLTTIEAASELEAFQWWTVAGHANLESDTFFETWRESFPHEGGDDPIATFIANDREHERIREAEWKRERAEAQQRREDERANTPEAAPAAREKERESRMTPGQRALSDARLELFTTMIEAESSERMADDMAMAMAPIFRSTTVRLRERLAALDARPLEVEGASTARPRPVIGSPLAAPVTLYVYGIGAEDFPVPGRTPEEAWRNVERYHRRFYEVECEPKEVPRDWEETVAGYVADAVRQPLLTISAGTELSAFSWWAQFSSHDPDGERWFLNRWREVFPVSENASDPIADEIEARAERYKDRFGAAPAEPERDLVNPDPIDNVLCEHRARMAAAVCRLDADQLSRLGDFLGSVREQQSSSGSRRHDAG